MKQTKDNPATNILGSGITGSDVDNAIQKSGYPLQTIIADMIRKEFRTQEEWSFIDSKSQEIRSIDIHAEKPLYEFNGQKQPRARPILSLNIECKQSELPYVFFLSSQTIQTENYPLFAGLFRKNIIIKTDDDSSIWDWPIINCVGLEQHKFLIQSAPSCMTFSKCVRKGKDVELSGTDAYQNLVMPLVKSLQHFDNLTKPPKTAFYCDCHIAFGIGLIQGPMVGVKVYGTKHKTELIPWVRVSRHESYENKDWTKRQRIYSIDIVHKDYFRIYLYNNLLPFAKSLAEKILKHQIVIAEGKGFVKGMGENWQTTIEERLETARLRKNGILSKRK